MSIQVLGIKNIDNRLKIYFDIEYNGEIYKWFDYAKGSNMEEFESYIKQREPLYKRYINSMEETWKTCPKIKVMEDLIYGSLIEVEIIKDEIVHPLEVYLEDIMTEYVQEILDSTAKSKGYDNIFTMISYLNSTNETFKKEAQSALLWRDSMWEKCFEIKQKIESEDLVIKTLEEFYSLLPVIVW